MEKIVHTLVFSLRNKRDLSFIDSCLESLTNSIYDDLLLIYNLGLFSNRELRRYLRNYDLKFEIIGKGNNPGLIQAKMASFNYIWANYPEVKYISEINLNMIFPKFWVDDLLEFMKKHPEEPMVSCGIITSQGQLYPERKEEMAIKNISKSSLVDMQILLDKLSNNRVVEGFSYPVLHRADILKKLGGYNLQFSSSKLGYKAEELLLAYRYYMGLKNNWKPKSYTKVRVYYDNFGEEEKLAKDIEGLVCQYGIKGLMELKKLYPQNSKFQLLAQELIDKY